MERKEAIEVIKKNWPDSSFTMLREALETLIPELKEDDGESMVKFIKNQLFNIKKTITDNYKLDTELTKAIDWLEKQSKDSPILSNSSNIGKDEQKPAFEMKTQEESLGIDSDTYSKIVDECIYGEQMPAYTKEYDFHGIKFIPKFAKGDTIKDKKRGEVSTIKDFSYDTGLYTHTYGQFPITIQDNYEIIYQKPTDWDDEDERMYKRIVSFIPQHLTAESYTDCITWLKSLKDRYTWKPSDEQMYNLSEAAHCDCVFFDMEILKGLYDELKKL